MDFVLHPCKISSIHAALQYSLSLMLVQVRCIHGRSTPGLAIFVEQSMVQSSGIPECTSTSVSNCSKCIPTGQSSALVLGIFAEYANVCGVRTGKL